jgi:heme b synthase
VSDVLRLVFWETTAGCNLECMHCRRLDVGKELMRSDLSTVEAFGLVDAVARVGAPILVLSGGEPLIRPDIFEIARYAREAGLPVALATNGTLIDRTIAESISASGIRRVAISLDGARDETHDSFRRLPGSFKAALTGFDQVKRAGVSLQINCTIARHNADELEDLFGLAESLGADALHLFMLVPVGCGVQIAQEQMLPPERYEDVLEWFYDRSQKTSMETKATCAPHYYRIMRQKAKERGTSIRTKTHGMDAVTRGCLAGTAVCFISHEGQVFPCGYLPVEAGDIRRQAFADVWSASPVFEALRDTSNLKGKCGVCEYRNVCEGCRARAYYETGDYLEEEPYCIYVPTKTEGGPRAARVPREP